MVVLRIMLEGCCGTAGGNNWVSTRSTGSECGRRSGRAERAGERERAWSGHSVAAALAQSMRYAGRRRRGVGRGGGPGGSCSHVVGVVVSAIVRDRMPPNLRNPKIAFSASSAVESIELQLDMVVERELSDEALAAATPCASSTTSGTSMRTASRTLRDNRAESYAPRSGTAPAAFCRRSIGA